MDIDLSIRNETSPSSEHERLRAAGPVVWSEALAGWLVSSYDDVKEILSDSNNFSNEGTSVADTFAPEAMLVTDGSLHHKIRAVWAKKAALRRLGQPIDMARSVLLLASDEADFITGHGLVADGGLTLRT